MTANVKVQKKKKKKKKKKKGTEKSNVRFASCEKQKEKIMFSSRLFIFCQPIVSEFFKEKSTGMRSM
jgi:hypothetical protein